LSVHGRATNIFLKLRLEREERKFARIGAKP